MRLQRLLALGILLLICFGFTPGNTMAIAEPTKYQFQATFNVESTGEPIKGDILQVHDTGDSPDAPYGLTKVKNTNYALFNPEVSNEIKVGPDPAKFGVEGKDFPFGQITFYGQGPNKIFGTEVGTSVYDFENLVGSGAYTIKITGGAGKFLGVKGILTFVEKNVLSPDPTAPIKGTWFVTGSFQK
jgi:hypothetical protein